MKKTLVALITLTTFSAAAEVKYSSHKLAGTFSYQDTTYTVSLPVDSVKRSDDLSRRVWALPEEYGKVKVSPDFTGSGKKVSCAGTEGPGLQGWVGQKPIVNCTWKAGNGSSAPTGDFNAYIISNKNGEMLTPNKEPKFTAKNIKADFDSIRLTYPITELSYRSGSSHSIYTFPGMGKIKKALNTQLKESGSLYRITQCEGNGNGKGTVGYSPKVECVWKMKGDAADVSNYGVVLLK